MPSATQRSLSDARDALARTQTALLRDARALASALLIASQCRAAIRDAGARIDTLEQYIAANADGARPANPCSRASAQRASVARRVADARRIAEQPRGCVTE